MFHSSIRFSVTLLFASVMVCASSAQAFSDDPANPFFLFDANGTPTSQSIFPFSATVDLSGPNDVDYVFVAARTGELLDVEALPNMQSDVRIEVFNSSQSAVNSVTDAVGLGGTESIRVSDAGTLIRISASPNASFPTGGFIYTLAAQRVIIPGGGYSQILNDNQYQAGELFELQAAIRNVSDMNATYDIYLALEVAGQLFWYDGLNTGGNPVWTQAVSSVQGVMLNRQQGIFLRDPLSFTVTPAFAAVSPVTFYMAAQNNATGEFGNVVTQTVQFQ